MVTKIKKILQIDTKNYNKKIPSILTLIHLLIFLYIYLLPTFHSLSPDTIITNLHTFLTLSYSFLSVAGWWMSYCYWCFLPQRKVTASVGTSEIFLCLGKTRDIWHPELNFMEWEDTTLTIHYFGTHTTIQNTAVFCEIHFKSGM